MDGDFLMVMYAWSPNYKMNAVGKDHYNLYARRSFDGGATWTTLPETFTHTDGLVYHGDGNITCEWYGIGGSLEPYKVCTEFDAGAFEKARNLSMLEGVRTTILDPRYAPSSGSIETDWAVYNEELGGNYLYTDDKHDPSVFFIVYETGDNTTVTLGEATPLDLFFSRAFDWGDHYEGFLDGVLNPADALDPELYLTSDWDPLESKAEDLSGEAAIISNPGGTLFYAIWNQWQEDEFENVFESDAMFRRAFWQVDADGDPYSELVFVNLTYADVSDELVFVASASDGDVLGDGIVEYEWSSNVNGWLGGSKRLQIGANSLKTGFHTISFRAKDGEGNWSKPVSFRLMIVSNLHQVFLPVVVNP
jgi:hypothetical protein